MSNSGSYNNPALFPGNEYSRMLSEKYHYKEWMISRFLNYIPDAEDLLKYVDTKSNLHTYIRANTLKIDPNSLKVRLLEKGFKLKNTIVDEVFEVINHGSDQFTKKVTSGVSTGVSSSSSMDSLIRNPSARISSNQIKEEQSNSKERKLPSLGSTFEYLKGYYYIQDLSSGVAVSEMDIHPSDDFHVLDMAAAPGGKTTHIAQKLNNLGKIVACESNPNRLPSLVFNLSRMGVKNTLVLKIKSEDIMQLGFRFDRVLLDAPCTCEGIILKDESRKRSRTIRDLNICSNRQKRMILAGFEALKPGGIMIYSTCSFAPEENEMIIQFLIDKFKNAQIEPLNYGSSGLTTFNDIIFSSNMNQTRRFYPHLHDTNGFFIAKIRKSTEPDGV
jgi:NOL1/NOP2/sun family putative RNA methylase